VKELRVRSEAAIICDLRFKKEFLTCCSSDRETVHIFKTGESGNTKSKIAFLGGICDYANSEWSFAKVNSPFSSNSVLN